MNERNVDALEQCIRSYRATWSHVPMDTEDARELAEALAARGVLAPSALTVEDCLAVESAMEPWPENDVMAMRTRGELESIAKGETNGV